MSTEQQSAVPRTSEQRYAEAKLLEAEALQRKKVSGVWYLNNGPRSCSTCADWYTYQLVHARCQNAAVNLKHHECARARTDDGLCGPEGAFYTALPPTTPKPVKIGKTKARRNVEDAFWALLVTGVWVGVFLLMNMM